MDNPDHPLDETEHLQSDVSSDSLRYRLLQEIFSVARKHYHTQQLLMCVTTTFNFPLGSIKYF